MPVLGLRVNPDENGRLFRLWRTRHISGQQVNTIVTHTAVNNGVDRDRKRRESASRRVTAFSACAEHNLDTWQVNTQTIL